MEIQFTTTERDFPIAYFKDLYSTECTIQISSIADHRAIWLGVDNPNPQILIKGEGWQKYPLPKEVMVSTRMHLSMEQVKELLPILERFALTGEING